MRVIADLHLHSKYSRATSQRMNVEEIARFAEAKGLTVVGTGDFTHPEWMAELKTHLTEDDDKGLYTVKSRPESPIRFMVLARSPRYLSGRGRLRRFTTSCWCRA